MEETSASCTNLLTAQELSRELKVPLSTIYQLTRRQEIPHVKIGKHYRFNLSQVITNLERPALKAENPRNSKTFDVKRELALLHSNEDDSGHAHLELMEVSNGN